MSIEPWFHFAVGLVILITVMGYLYDQWFRREEPDDFHYSFEEWSAKARKAQDRRYRRRDQP